MLRPNLDLSFSSSTSIQCSLFYCSDPTRVLVVAAFFSLATKVCANYARLEPMHCMHAASAIGVPTPVAYKLRRGAARGLMARGMNFAVGGAGVLDTGNFQRNISAQIDLFQAQQQHPAAAAAAHGGGVALVVVSGNDYSYAADKDNSTSVRELLLHIQTTITIYMIHLKLMRT